VPEPPKYTGQYHLRMPPSLHEALTLKSESEEVSLNQYMVTALARAVGYPEVNRVPTVIKETKKKYKH
jgi:predicted HicB family RNase H-like nuclease